MKLYKLNEKSKSVCPFCHALRETTFKEREVPFKSGKGVVKDLLVAVCDECDKVVAIPQQSVPRIREALKVEKKSVEARIPRQLSDALMLSCETLGYTANEPVEVALFKIFLDRISLSSTLKKNLSKLANSDEAEGKASARLSLKLNDVLYSKFFELQKETKLSSSEVCRGILVQMKSDLLDKKNTKLQQEVRKLLLVAS